MRIALKKQYVNLDILIREYDSSHFCVLSSEACSLLLYCRCSYLFQLVSSLSFLSPRGQFVALTVLQWFSCLSEPNTVEKSCQRSWLSDKNVDLHWGNSYHCLNTMCSLRGYRHWRNHVTNTQHWLILFDSSVCVQLSSPNTRVEQCFSGMHFVS